MSHHGEKPSLLLVTGHRHLYKGSSGPRVSVGASRWRATVPSLTPPVLPVPVVCLIELLIDEPYWLVIDSSNQKMTSKGTGLWISQWVFCSARFCCRLWRSLFLSGPCRPVYSATVQRRLNRFLRPMSWVRPKTLPLPPSKKTSSSAPWIRRMKR